VSENDRYTCPAGEFLTKGKVRADRRDNIDHYRNITACATCVLKSRCTPDKVKRLKRWEHEGVLDQYDDAELDRKKVAAMHALFITTPAPTEPLDAAEGRDENDERTIDLQPGQITMLEPGEEVQTSAPAESGQTYEPFQYRTLLQVSAALGVPYAYLSNDMLKANYSNSRLALLEFRRRIEAYQHAVIVWQFCRQVWARWMDTAVLAGALDLPGYDRRRREYLACGWLPPKWDWVDPLKDARAEIEQIDAGLKSRTQALAERGYDAEQVDAEIAADKAREQSLGIDFQSKPSAVPPNAITGTLD
jgi:lambda family phage portal protein